MTHAWLITILSVRCTADPVLSVVAVAGVNEAAAGCGRYGLSVDPHEFGGIGCIGGNIGGSEDWLTLSQRFAALSAAAFALLVLLSSLGACLGDDAASPRSSGMSGERRMAPMAEQLSAARRKLDASRQQALLLELQHNAARRKLKG